MAVSIPRGKLLAVKIGDIGRVDIFSLPVMCPFGIGARSIHHPVVRKPLGQHDPVGEMPLKTLGIIGSVGIGKELVSAVVILSDSVVRPNEKVASRSLHGPIQQLPLIPGHPVILFVEELQTSHEIGEDFLSIRDCKLI